MGLSVVILCFAQYVGGVRGEETTYERNVEAKNNIRNGNKQGHGSETCCITVILWTSRLSFQ